MKRHIMTFTFTVGMILFGFVGFFKTFSGLDASSATFVRGFWGVVTLAVIAIVAKREIFITNISYVLRCLVWGALMSLIILFFFRLMDIANQSLAIILLFGGQGLWFPLYVYFFMPQESQKTKWSTYIATSLLTITGIACALGGAASLGNFSIVQATVYGIICSLSSCLYYVSGRWLFFSNNKDERNALQRFLPSTLMERLENDEKSASKNLSPFWSAYQRTFFQAIGMCLSITFAMSGKTSFINAFNNQNALLYGFLLGALCLAGAILLITWADLAEFCNQNGEVKRLSSKFKGISQQIELVIALLAGYLFLNDKLGITGWLGVLILIISYTIGIFWSERVEVSQAEEEQAVVA